MTFSRQVLSLVVAPFLLEHPKVIEIFPPDAIERAKHMLDLLKTGVGAYTDSRGCIGIREEVAKFIEDRDGHSADAEVTSHTLAHRIRPYHFPHVDDLFDRRSKCRCSFVFECIDSKRERLCAGAYPSISTLLGIHYDLWWQHAWVLLTRGRIVVREHEIHQGTSACCQRARQGRSRPCFYQPWQSNGTVHEQREPGRHDQICQRRRDGSDGR